MRSPALQCGRMIAGLGQYAIASVFRRRVRLNEHRYHRYAPEAALKRLPLRVIILVCHGQEFCELD